MTPSVHCYAIYYSFKNSSVISLLDLSYMEFNHYHVHMFPSHTITPCFYLHIIHLLCVKLWLLQTQILRILLAIKWICIAHVSIVL